MHYAIGDIHGCYDEMIMLLEKIEARDPEARFIFVGDFLDRGPKVWDVIEWVMSHVTPDGKYQSIMGNHELYVLNWFLEFREWEQNTYLKNKSLYGLPKAQYDFHLWIQKMDYLSSEKLLPIMYFFAQLPFEKQVLVPGKDGSTIRYRIVHAWIPGPEDDTEEKRNNKYLFERHFTGNTENDDIIICGHTPTASPIFYEQDQTAPGMIAYRKNAIHIDCGCTYKPYFNEFPCMLGAICLETLEEFYPWTLKERMRMTNPNALDAKQKNNWLIYDLKYLTKKNKYREEMLRRLP